MVDNDQSNDAIDDITSNPHTQSNDPKGLDIAHFVMYGQPGHPRTEETEVADGEYERVQSSAWNHKPFKQTESAEWELPLDVNTLRKLARGFHPQEMEDKWFVYSTGPEGQDGKLIVSLIRSWTGFRVIELEIEGVTDAMLDPILKDATGEAKIKRITYATGDHKVTEEGAKETAREVARWVLAAELQ